MNRNTENEFKRILVFRIGHLGDSLVALPAFWALRRAFPSAHITLLTNTDLNNPHYISARNVLPKQGLFDSCLSYLNSVRGPGAWLEAVKLSVKIRKERFDAVFYLMPRGRGNSQILRDERFFRFAGIRRILCADYSRRNTLPARIPVPAPEVESESEFLLNCLRSEGVPVRQAETDLLLNAEERTAARDLLQESCEDDSRMVLAVAPGSKWKSKMWSEQRFGAVVQRLIEAFDIFPIVLGGSEDTESGERLLAMWGTGANAAGTLGVREAAAVLERCALYLGNDTGTMHLAASVGTKCVCVFSAIDWPGRWYPFGKGHRIIRKAVDCEGCRLEVSANGGMCLELISVDEVFNACVEMLRPNASASVRPSSSNAASRQFV